ncbi:hypothetical protein BC830DRAFT_80684 [Chytriomyces sp. MP71]|nr:hypothetical protein BC830DRAFT_80684 [Chytriomyces sp. MP71]
MADSMDSRLNTVSSIVSGFEITWYSVWLVSMVLFLARHNTPCIRSRTILLSSTQAVGHLLVMFFSGGCDYLGADIPCFLRMWLINLGFTAWSIALMSRFVLLYTSYRRNLNILFNPAASTPEYEVDEFGCPVEKPEGLDENKGSKESLYRGSHVDPPPSKCSPWDFATIIANMKLRFMRRTDAWIMEGSIQKQFWKPIVAIVLLMLVYLSLAQVFTQTARIRVGSGSRLCSFGALEYGFALCWGILSLCVGGSFMMWICFSCPDTDYIFSDLTLSCVSGILLAFVYLILSSNSRLSLYAHSSWLFLEVLLVLSHITSIIVPVIQSFIEGWKATRVTFDMNHFAFEQVLRHRILYADLKKFAESGKYSN